MAILKEVDVDSFECFIVKCSMCNKESIGNTGDMRRWTFCPKCGARIEFVGEGKSMNTIPLSNRFQEISQGHPEIWECTLNEFIEKVIPILQDHQKRNKLKRKVIETAIQFLRIKFDKKELKGTIEHEVAKAIEESLIYYVNCLGEEV